MEGDSPKVFVGPITVDEIRWRLKRERQAEMIDRRATISDTHPSRTIYSDSPTTDYLMKKHFFGSASEDLSDSFISEYLTPNETVCNDGSVTASNTYATPCESLQNSVKYDDISPDFNKISQNIDNVEEITKLTNSVCLEPDSTNITKDKEHFIQHLAEALNFSSSSQYTSAVECSNINNHQDNTSLTQISNNIEDPILVSSDDDDDDEIDSNSEPIYISSDADSSFEEEVDTKIELHKQIQQGLHKIETPAVSLSNSLPTEVFSTNFYVPLDELDKSNDSEILYQIKIESSSSSLQDSNNIATNVSVCFDKSNNSEVLEQRDTVSSSPLQESSDYGFNDTLEEMEMALKHGLDYTMPEEITDTYKTDICEEQLGSSKEYTAQLIAEPSTTKPKLHSDKYRKTLIPIKNSATNVQPHKTPTKHLSVKEQFNFKMPLKPVTVRKSPNFKNVVSPIAVYIKSSPKVPLVQHIRAKQVIPKHLGPAFAASSLSNKENDQLPFRVYKPAKHVIVEKEKEIKLPGSIQKYVPTVPTVTKHHRRIAEKKTSSATVEELLLKEDLTLFDCDASHSNSSLSLQDVSYHTTKPAYIN